MLGFCNQVWNHESNNFPLPITILSTTHSSDIGVAMTTTFSLHLLHLGRKLQPLSLNSFHQCVPTFIEYTFWCRWFTDGWDWQDLYVYEEEHLCHHSHCNLPWAHSLLPSQHIERSFHSSPYLLFPRCLLPTQSFMDISFSFLLDLDENWAIWLTDHHNGLLMNNLKMIISEWSSHSREEAQPTTP